MAGQAVLLIKAGAGQTWTVAGEQPMPYGAIMVDIPDGQTALQAVVAYVQTQPPYPLGTEATFAELGTPATYDMEANWVQKS